MFGRILGAAVLSNSAGQREVWAKRDRAARMRKNMPRVNAAIAAAGKEREAAEAAAETAANAKRAELARKLVDLEAEIVALQYAIAAVETTKAAFPNAIAQFSH
jgi:hypothetical protein